MSERPTSLPTWAEDSAYVAPGKGWNGFDPKLAPSAGLEAEGWEPGAKPNVRVWNWLLNKVFRWLAYLAPLALVNWLGRALDTSSTPTSVRGIASRAWAQLQPDMLIAICSTSSDGIAQRSSHGDEWIETGSALTGTLTDVTWMGGTVERWLITGHTGKLFHRAGGATDGTAWTATGPGSGDDFYAVAVNDDATLAVAVGENGRLYSSADGTSWTSRTSNSGAHLTGVAFGGGLWVAVGQAHSGVTNLIVTSPNGTTWTARLNANLNIAHVVYDAEHEVFVAVHGTSGTNVLHISTSGSVSASVGTLPFTQCTDLVTDGHGTLIAFNNYGRASISTDAGVTWGEPFIVGAETLAAAHWCGALGCLYAGGASDGTARLHQSLRGR